MSTTNAWQIGCQAWPWVSLWKWLHKQKVIPINCLRLKLTISGQKPLSIDVIILLMKLNKWPATSCGSTVIDSLGLRQPPKATEQSTLPEEKANRATLEERRKQPRHKDVP